MAASTHWHLNLDCVLIFMSNSDFVELLIATQIPERPMWKQGTPQALKNQHGAQYTLEIKTEDQTCACNPSKGDDFALHN